MSRRRNTSVRNGIENTRAMRRIIGERARRNGLARRSWVVNASVDDVV